MPFRITNSRHRVFFALPLPEATRARLAVQCHLLRLPSQARPVGLENFNLTLAIMGDVPSSALLQMDEVASGLRSGGFPLDLFGMGSFGKNSPESIWVGCRPNPLLEAFQAKLSHVMRQAGTPPESRRFLPHVTLAHLPELSREEAVAIEKSVVRLALFELPRIAIESFSLYRSEQNKDGSARYHELANYPLL